MVDLEHVLLRAGARVTEDLLEYAGHVACQINRVVVDDDVPRHVDGGTAFGFLFNDGFRHAKATAPRAAPRSMATRRAEAGPRAPERLRLPARVRVRSQGRVRRWSPEPPRRAARGCPWGRVS